jgi:hypothetical protein
MDAITVEISFPGEKLIDRDVVEITGLFDGHPAAADGFNDGGLAPNRPALARPR